MNTLNLGSDEMPEKKKKSNTRNLKIALGLAAVILVPTIGSTLAGSITVSGGSIEFGQGVVTTAACDGAISVTPESALVSGAFIATAIAVTGVAAGCDYKYLTFKVLDDNDAPQVIGSPGGNETFCKFLFHATSVASTFTTASSGGCDVYVTDATSFTFRPGQNVSSNAVQQITLESSNS